MAHKIVVAMLTWTNFTTHKQTQTLLKAFSSHRGDVVGHSRPEIRGRCRRVGKFLRSGQNIFGSDTLSYKG